jgi:transposase InsO family protein
LWIWLRATLRVHWVSRTAGRPRACRIEPATIAMRRRRKPEWVVRQLVLLSAHLPNAGCRTLATTFNRVFAHRDVSVSKSFAHAVMRRHAHAIAQARKAIRSAKPQPVAVNQCWAMDMTGRADAAGNMHTILGIVDHGSRRALSLPTLARKCGWSLLGHLCFAIGKFGKPRFIRTDNERCFTGRVFSTGLRSMGIKHQRIELHCPWQNGRVERFFGTLKRSLKRWEFDGRSVLEVSLAQFVRWYNEIRPHQGLGGMTPAEAWSGIDPFHAPHAPSDVRFVQAWDGLLRGFHIRR